MLSGEPQGAGESELPPGGREGHWGGAFLDEFGEFFCSAEKGLVDNARLAPDAGALDEVVIEAVALPPANSPSSPSFLRGRAG
jgi:hypothetical protein